MKTAACITTVLATVFSTLSLGACDDAAVESDALSADEALLEIVDNLRKAGYPDSEIDIRDDDTVIVGGDAVVSLEASREMIGHDDHEEHEDDIEWRQYRSTNQVASWVYKICVNGSVLTGTASAALNDALANYNDLDLRFVMERTTGFKAGCDALITISMIDGTSASAGFPSAGLPYDKILFGDDIAPLGQAVTAHVLTHELGHCIGMRHTDYYNRAISCGGEDSNEGDADVGVVHIPGTPTTAIYNGSVMNACYNLGSTGEWTNTDVTALTTLYPAPPPPTSIPAIPSPLSKISDMCYGSYSMFWTAKPGATYYQLYRSTSSGFTSPVQVYSGGATGEDINVASGTWYLRARACNSLGCSGWTNQVSATRLGKCD